MAVCWATGAGICQACNIGLYLASAHTCLLAKGTVKGQKHSLDLITVLAPAWSIIF